MEQRARTVVSTKGGTVQGELFTKGTLKYLKVQCGKTHPPWDVSINNLVSRNSWCPTCYGNAPLTIEQMKQLAIDRGGLCLSDKYGGRRVNLQWQCAYEHKWSASPGNVHTHLSWCPHCKINLGEELVRATLEEAFPGEQFVRTRAVPWMNGMELDGYNAKLRLCFEYQGKQHAERVEHFQRDEKDFDAQQERDILKDELVNDNCFTLLSIPHTVPYPKVRMYVRALLIELYTEVNEKQQLCSDIDFYNKVRANGPSRTLQHEKICKIIADKGGRALSDYVGYRLPMRIWCNAGQHEFLATPESIDQKPERGTRFCNVCCKTKKIPDEKHAERLAAQGWTFVGSESIARGGGRSRRVITATCVTCGFVRTMPSDTVGAKLKSHRGCPGPKKKELTAAGL